MRTIILSVLLLAGLALTGCSGGASVWEAGYAPQAGVKARVAGSAPVIEKAVYAALESQPQVPGFEVVGTTRFRGERLGAEWASPGSPLAAHAKHAGANLVRAAERYVGNETRTKAMRTGSPGAVGAVGTTGGGGPARGEATQTVEVEVPIFEYLAVYYRAAAG